MPIICCSALLWTLECTGFCFFSELHPPQAISPLITSLVSAVSCLLIQLCLYESFCAVFQLLLDIFILCSCFWHVCFVILFLFLDYSLFCVWVVIFALLVTMCLWIIVSPFFSQKNHCTYSVLDILFFFCDSFSDIQSNQCFRILQSLYTQTIKQNNNKKMLPCINHDLEIITIELRGLSIILTRIQMLHDVYR